MRHRPDLAGKLARERTPAAYLQGLDDDEAARVVGSREKLQRVLAGEKLDTILNEHRDPAYHVARVGDGVRAIAGTLPLGAQSIPVNTAYEIAQQSGGVHRGLLLNIRENLGVKQLKAGAASLQRQIEDHQAWIADPSSKPGVNLHPVADVARWRTQKWPADIARLTRQKEIYEAVLKEKESGILPSGG